MIGVWEMIDEREYEYRFKWLLGFYSGGVLLLVESMKVYRVIGGVLGILGKLGEDFLIILLI